MEISHDIFEEKELALVLAFLNKEERQMMVEKLMPRIDEFIENKLYGKFENIFQTSTPSDPVKQKEEPPCRDEDEVDTITAIQNSLQEDLSESDNDPDDPGCPDDQVYPLSIQDIFSLPGPRKNVQKSENEEENILQNDNNISDDEDDDIEISENMSDGFDMKIEAMRLDVAKRLEREKSPEKQKTSHKGKQTEEEAIEEIYKFLQDTDDSDDIDDNDDEPDNSILDKPYESGSDTNNKNIANTFQEIYDFLQDSDEEEEEEEEEEVESVRVKEEQEINSDSETDTDYHSLALTSMVNKVLKKAIRENKEMDGQLGLKKRRL